MVHIKKKKKILKKFLTAFLLIESFTLILQIKSLQGLRVQPYGILLTYLHNK